MAIEENRQGIGFFYKITTKCIVQQKYIDQTQCRKSFFRRTEEYAFYVHV